MIVNVERDPNLSLYYLGAELLQLLMQEQDIILDDLYEKLKYKCNQDIPIDFFYYALDWLYMNNSIELLERRVLYANRKVDSKEDKAL